MKTMQDNSVDMILTDIPYGEVNAPNRGFADLGPCSVNMRRGSADDVTFDIREFLEQCVRIAKSNITVFCGIGQVSDIFNYLTKEQKAVKGTARQLIWEKTNPVPINGKVVYLNGIENAIWFRKSGGTFNARCKNTVFRYPIWGGDRIHPTEKHHGLLRELILDNSNVGDIIFDPCAGSGSTLLVAKQNGRRYLGCEINKDYYRDALLRLNNTVPCANGDANISGDKLGEKDAQFGIKFWS